MPVFLTPRPEEISLGSIRWIKEDSADHPVTLYGLRAAAANHPCIIVDGASFTNRTVKICVVRAWQFEVDETLIARS